MIRRNGKNVLEVSFGEGVFRSTIWWDVAAETYHYDGPVSNGPPEVRNSGRGPHWMGTVSENYVRSVLRQLKKLDVAHTVREE